MGLEVTKVLSSLYIQAIQKFYQDHNYLIFGGLLGIILAVVGLVGWLKSSPNQQSDTTNSFPFKVIKPQSRELKKLILGGESDDRLADRNIPYQQRAATSNVRRLLQEQIENHHWVLILGRTGVGKTREAVELVNHLNRLGWTVLYLKPGEWLDFPAQIPMEISKECKLVFFLDDLNRKIQSRNLESDSKAEENPVQRLKLPLQEQLLNLLSQYESLYGQDKIRVIATASNEKRSQFLGEPSPWSQLQWEKYPKLWGRFWSYSLPEPDDDAIIGVLAETILETNISAQPEVYPQIACQNDGTFRNVVENLLLLKDKRLPLNVNTYLPSLEETWSKRYQEALNKHPASRYIYDAVEMLQKFDIPLERFIVEPTALLMVRGNLWQKFKNRWLIRSALNYLIEVENILQPRNGQIEGKGKQVEVGEYIRPFSKLVVRLTNAYPQLLDFGLRLLYLKRDREALNCFNKVNRINPQDDSAWFYKGNALYKLGRYEDALVSYKKVLSIQPNDESAWINLGTALKKLGRNEEAVTSFDKALSIHPNDPRPWYNRGIALFNLGRNEEAIDSLDKSLSIQPDRNLAWYYRGNALYLLKRHPSAVASYDKALAINPDDDAAWYNRGMALYALGRYEEAVASYDTVLFIKPSDGEAWYHRGIALYKLGRNEEAVASYDKVLSINPDRDLIWNHRGAALSNLGRYEEAVASYDKVLAAKPKDEVTWYNRGLVLYKLKRYADAVASYDKALLIKPDKDDAWYKRGDALYKLGYYEEAVVSYDKVLSVQPANDTARYNKACCYALQGNIYLALESLSQAINLNIGYRKMARSDSNFERIRKDKGFQALIAGE